MVQEAPTLTILVAKDFANHATFQKHNGLICKLMASSKDSNIYRSGSHVPKCWESKRKPISTPYVKEFFIVGFDLT